jgi:hypothetical protein
MRKIEPALVKLIDARLAKNGLAQELLGKRGDLKAARALVLPVAHCLVGIRERGRNKGPEVELLQDTIGGISAEAWCMSYVQSVLAYIEVKLGVKSPIYPSESCMNTLSKTPKSAHVKRLPAPGAIVIWQHGTSWQGHTGFFDHGLGFTQAGGKPGYKSMMVVEGNTGKGVAGGKVVREGDGVYYNERGYTGTGNMKVRGFLIPF